MLKRSPKSRGTSFLIVALSAIAIFIAVDSLMSLRNIANGHGKRKTYYVLEENKSQGSRITDSDLSAHEMFSNDAPRGSLTESNKLSGRYARYELVKGSILTKRMVSEKVISTIDTGNRIIFVPSKEILDSSISNRADLLSVSVQDYGAQKIASGARILYGLSTKSEMKNDQNPNPGYFVEVSEFEASQIAAAISSGEVHFALTQTND